MVRRTGIVIAIVGLLSVAGVAIAQQSGTSGSLVVANAFAPADALTGGPLASRLGAPLVTTHVSEVPTETRRQVDALRPQQIILLGGPAVMDASVEDYFRSLPWGPSVTRLGGADRFGTAEQIAEFLARQRLPDAGSVEGVGLDELVTENELDQRLGTSSVPIEQVLPMPESNSDGQQGSWVRNGPVRTRLTCEPDGAGLPEVAARVEMQWMGDGESSDSQGFSRGAYVYGSDPSDIEPLTSELAGVHRGDVIEAGTEGWVSINVTTPSACHAVWSVNLKTLPGSGG